MSELLWSIENVTLAGLRPRLDDVSLDIAAGTTAIVGYSGAGKTSLLNLLTEFERPDSGRITASLPQRRDGLSLYWVPQTYGLWPHCTVREHIATVMPTGDDNDESVHMLLADFDLLENADRFPDRLSGGERSRLAVARALASRAAVLVMDEPLVHVDPSRIGKYWRIVNRHCEKTGASLVIATHSPEVVLKETSRAVCLKEGRVAYAGPVDELYHHPTTSELADFLGPGNWMSSDDAQQWLSTPIESARCFRPEHVEIHHADDSPFIVQDARFAGAVCELELLDEKSGRKRNLIHRTPARQIKTGDRVRMRALLSVALCMLLLGCNVETGPQLPIASVRNWPMPPSGYRTPAPRGMTVGPDNELYVLDDAGRVLVFDVDGSLIRQWAMPESSVGNPEGICVLKDGRIAVADTHYFRIVFFDANGYVLKMLGGHGKEPGQFIYPVAITQDDDENIYVCEYGENDRVQKFDVEGKFLLQFGSFGTEPGQFQRPSGIVWHDGTVYVADAFNNRIQKFSDRGEFLGIIGESEPSAGLHYPYDMTKGPDANLYIVEYGAGRISKLDRNGKVLGRFGSTGTGPGQFSTPWGLTIDSQSRLLVADTGNRRIVELKQ